MEVYEAIEKRYSVRGYEDRPVEQDKLERILNAGRIAPSASNRQNWKFVVARDPDVRNAVAAATGQAFVSQAPVIIAVIGTDPVYQMRCGVHTAPVDGAIAMDHMTLAAVAEGLGTCWVGAFDQDAAREALNVPESAMIIDLLPMGYPNTEPKPKSRKPFEEVISYDKFQ